MEWQNIIPSFGSLGSFVNVFIGGAILCVLIVIIKFVMDFKFKYVYRAEIFKRRQNYDELPTSVRNYGIAGYFKKRSGKTVFRIKYGIRPSQVIELSKLPDPNYMIGNKVTYLQLNKDNFVQAKSDIDWDGGLKIEPVEDDLKFDAMLAMKENERILDTKQINPMIVGIVALAFIIVAFVVGFYFLSKACT